MDSRDQQAMTRAIAQGIEQQKSARSSAKLASWTVAIPVLILVYWLQGQWHFSQWLIVIVPAILGAAAYQLVLQAGLKR